jgi:hypothetical protein
MASPNKSGCIDSAGRKSAAQCLRPALAALLAFFAIELHAGNFRADCEARLARTEVSVDQESAPYVTDSSFGIAELTARNSPGARGESTVGLTVAHYLSAIDVVQNGLQDPETREYCMRPHFKVRLSYSPIEVFVGREIQRGSCAYAEVVHHEEKHVAAYELQLKKAAEAVERALRAHYGNTIFYGDPAKLDAQLAYSIRQQWLPFAEHQLEAVEPVQLAIDSPQEYARYRTACNGEIDRILKGLR